MMMNSNDSSAFDLVPMPRFLGRGNSAVGGYLFALCSRGVPQ